jgi:hypothetical protein
MLGTREKMAGLLQRGIMTTAWMQYGEACFIKQDRRLHAQHLLQKLRLALQKLKLVL